MMTNKMPYYLSGYETLYRKDPREANKKWFNDATYGLFLHYGLYALHATHEWCQLREKIYVSDYAKLKDKFTAKNFDPTYIVQFAKDCGMKYINITTRHHDSFCLWDSKTTDFNVMNSPAQRDLVAELYEACKKENIALFLYYSHGRDWKHPHAPNNDKWGGAARPEYNPPEPTYAYGEDHNLNIYIDWMKKQVEELVEKFPEVAGIWLDGQAVPKSGDVKAFRIQEFYDHIHNLAPHILVSYKQGITGTEDFFAPEHDIPKKAEGIDELTSDHQKMVSRLGKIDEVPNKKIEVCATMVNDPIAWGYSTKGKHKSANEIYDQLVDNLSSGANLCINTGVCPDGSIDPIDDQVLREVGKRIKANGII